MKSDLVPLNHINFVRIPKYQNKAPTFVVFQSQESHPMRDEKQKENYLHPSLVFATIKRKIRESLADQKIRSPIHCTLVKP
jgi:hypothetical protein